MSITAGPNWAFRFMSLIHDNILLRKWTNPKQPLQNAGLEAGQTVLEVGCGPGFFTIPAAQILGDSGKLYALDVHPLAKKAVTKKLLQYNIQNVEMVLGNITKTAFTSELFDLIFLFGVPRMLKNKDFLDRLLEEVKRVLKPGGILSIKTKRIQIIPKCEDMGFIFKKSNSGILLFTKR